MQAESDGLKKRIAHSKRAILRRKVARTKADQAQITSTVVIPAVRAQFPQRSKVERQQSSPATRRLNLVIDGTFRLASCADCHRYLESGNQFGKVVLKV